MPASITHQIFSEEALPLLPEPIKNAATAHPDYYFFGAQGPDVFFFLQPLNRREFNLGRFLHRYRVWEVFDFFRRYTATLEGREREEIEAYLAGYLCHYAADAVFHPFVYEYVNARGNISCDHQQMESDWDVYFALLRGQSATGWKYPVDLRRLDRDGSLYRLYHALCRELGRRELKKTSFARGLRLAARYLAFFHGRDRRKGLVRLEKLLRLPPVLSSNCPRKDTEEAFLSGKEFETYSGVRNVDALFEKALSELARLARLFYSDAPLGEEFARSFLTGKPAEEPVK